jgi:hypothetical protein
MEHFVRALEASYFAKEASTAIGGLVAEDALPWASLAKDEIATRDGSSYGHLHQFAEKYAIKMTMKGAIGQGKSIASPIVKISAPDGFRSMKQVLYTYFHVLS